MACIESGDSDYEALCRALNGAVRNTDPGTTWNVQCALLRRKTLQDRLTRAGVRRSRYQPEFTFADNLDVLRRAYTILTEPGIDDLDTRVQKASIIMDLFGRLRTLSG